MVKIDRLMELENGNTVLSIIGLTKESHNLAKTLGNKYQVFAIDPHLEKDFNLSFSPDKNKSDFENKSVDEVLNASGVFYISGSSTFVTNWEQIRENALKIGPFLKKGDWVIFGDDVEPNMAEIVLIPLLEKCSYLRVGEGFDIAFHPKVLDKFRFSNTGYQVKFSHNLIVDKVSLLLDIQKDEFKSFNLNFVDEDYQITQIKEVIKDTWLPVLNGMDNTLFKNFIEACEKQRFLDKYPELKLSNEWRVNYKRFFKFAKELGLKHSVVSLNLKNIKQAS